MEVPKEIKAYCKKCKKHTVHKVKIAKKGKRRTLSFGQSKFIEKTKGYTSKVGAKAKPVKQSKKTVLMLECSVCGSKHEKVLPDSKKQGTIKRS